MANPEHVEIAKQGAAAIREWRTAHTWETLELSGADLGGVNLVGAFLSDCNLRSADLRRAHLRGAIMTRADLSSALLQQSDLRGAELVEANMRGTHLSDANLAGADLRRAYLDDCDLRSANLSESSLLRANLRSTSLARATLAQSDLGDTSFHDCDLSQVEGLDKTRHWLPSNIGIDTLARTLKGLGGQFTETLRTFFEEAGVPQALLDQFPPLLETQPIQFFSCFISYGSEDQVFADKLDRDLRRAGIRCWKYNADAVPGRGVWDQIDRAVLHHDKTIVVCSEWSLGRPGVQGEIERALQKEEQLDKDREASGNPEIDTDVLVPVRLDDHILKGWKHARKADVVKKHIGDFRGWEDDATYQEAFQQLLRALDPRSKLGLG